MQSLPGARKKSVTWATSAIMPKRLFGSLSISLAIFSGGTPRIKSVSIGVGPIAFTVIFQGANSRAITRVKLSTAALLAA